MTGPPGKCYCVTIQRSVERRRRFEKAWANLNFEYHFGVDYLIDDVYSRAEDAGLIVGNETWEPQIAITTSHYELLRKLIDRGERFPVTIFEDDAVPTGKPWVCDDFDLVRWFWDDRHRWMGTACYSLTEDAAKKILAERTLRYFDRQIENLGFLRTSRHKTVGIFGPSTYAPFHGDYCGPHTTP